MKSRKKEEKSVEESLKLLKKEEFSQRPQYTFILR
jgi:hypothetical protein